MFIRAMQAEYVFGSKQRVHVRRSRMIPSYALDAISSNTVLLCQDGERRAEPDPVI